jgi:hypothetical protein
MLKKKQSVGLILLILSILFYLYQYHVFIETKESRKRIQFNEIQKTNLQHEKLMEKQKNHYLNQIKELKETKQKLELEKNQILKQKEEFTKKISKKISKKESKNELTPDERDPKKKLKLRVLSQSIFRKNGFEFLEKSFHSFSNGFASIGLDYEYHAYSPKLEGNQTIPNFSHSKFFFKQVDSSKLTQEQKNVKIEFPSTPTEQLILSQIMNFIYSLSTFSSVCQKNELFLYIEDDFVVCDHITVQIASIYFWALKHRSTFKSLRIGFGFSGFLMKCEDIPELLNTILKDSVDLTFPIDYKISHWWKMTEETQNSGLLVFKYNLFDRIGSMEDEIPSNRPKCFSGNYQEFNPFIDKFDTQSCEKFNFSPCDHEEIQKDLISVHEDTLKVRSILRYEEKHLLMEKLNVKVHSLPHNKTLGVSCDITCNAYGAICSENLYPFVNECEEMKKFYGCNEHPSCISLGWAVYKFDPPMKDNLENCIYTDYPQYYCWRKSFDEVEKICPCLEDSK